MGVARETLYGAVEDRRESGLSFLRDLLEIETENPPGRAYPEAAAFLESALADRGYDAATIDVPGSVVREHYPDRTEHDRVNVLARRGPDAPAIDPGADPGPDEDRDSSPGSDPGSGPHVHFTGHFDVVPAGEDWSRDPYDPRVEGGRLYARGASDMKSGLAASLLAVDALTDVATLPRGSITQSMTVDEETGGFTGLGHLVDEGHVASANTDYCVYTECFDSSRICLGHRGVLKFRVTADGEKAHGCMAQNGRNAVTAMTDFLSRIGDYRARLHERTTDEPVIPVESRRADVSATMLDAGHSENVVPDRSTATFYRVLVPEETVADARDEIRDLMGAAAAATGAAFDYEEIMFAEPTTVPRDCTVAEAFAREIRPFHGDPEFVVSPGSDDQRFVVNDAGIRECVVYGPGLLEQAHVADEYVPPSEVVTAAKVMATAAADLLGVLEESGRTPSDADADA